VSETNIFKSTNDPSAIRERVVMVIKTVFDPEIPVNIWELGLIYRVDVDEKGEVEIDMTLTSPACPVAGSMPGEVQEKVANVAGVNRVKLELVWEPSWDPSKMSEAARITLGLF
jgi:FeS assembly SUF system protein